MARVELPAPVADLILQLRRLPGVGPRSAERMALWILQEKDGAALKLSTVLGSTRERMGFCPDCGFFAEIIDEKPVCRVCVDHGRDRSMICVVEQPTDVLPMERTGSYRGLYHVLGGRLAPLDHVGPEDLKIPALIRRAAETGVVEVILALSSDVEGEATASYLMELLRPVGVRVSRIAQGMPAGSGLDSADEVSLSRAMAYRVAFSHVPMQG